MWRPRGGADYRRSKVQHIRLLGTRVNTERPGATFEAPGPDPYGKSIVRAVSRSCVFSSNYPLPTT
jgi:hypothetical protein